MNLHVLGCYGPYPNAGGATSGYLVEHDGQLLLMDCGSGVLGRLMQKADPASLSAILLSHLHYDHVSDLLVLSYYLQQRGVTLKVFVPPEDASPVRSLLSDAAYDVQPYPEMLRFGDVSVTTFPVRHPVPCRALRLNAGGKTLVYTGDSNTCPGLCSFAQNADVLLCDAAFLDAEWKETLPHFSAREAARLADEAQVKRLYLTHLPVRHDKKTLEAEAAASFTPVKAVEPGMVIAL